MSIDESFVISDYEIEGLRTAVTVVRKDLDDSDSGLCKSGRNSVGCCNCATDIDIWSGRDGYCLRAFDKSFQLGLGDAKLIKNSKPALMTIRVSFYLKAPRSFLEAFENYSIRNITNSIYFRRIDSGASEGPSERCEQRSMYITSTLWDIQQFAKENWNLPGINRFMKEFTEEDFGWLIFVR